MARYKCMMCGEIFEVADGETPVCPLCMAEGDDLKELADGEEE